MEIIDYKEQDRKAIINYLKGHQGEVTVESIIQESGANRLRVYSLLWELSHDGTIIVVKESDLGTPEVVMLCS